MTDVKPVDPAAVLAVLAAYWANPAPARFTDKVPGRIAGGPHDQMVPAGAENPYWEIVRQIPLDAMSLWIQRDPMADSLRHVISRRTPAILLDRRVVDQMASVLAAGFADATPQEIDWVGVVVNWDLPFAKAGAR